MNIYLVRHAQKDGSAKTTEEEHYHRKLTDIGSSQAKHLARHMKKYNITKVFSSDMARAVSTAKEAAIEFGITDFVQDSGLREADPCTIPNHPDRDKIVADCWKDWDYIPERGESYNQAKQRFSNFFWENIVNSSKDTDNILIVSHGRVLRIFLSDYLEGGKETIKTTYGHVAISHLMVNKKSRKIKIVTYNDNSYLPGDLRV